MNNNIKNIMMISRLVVLPEYQGFNISRKIADEMAKFFIEKKKRVRIVTSHIGMIKSLQKNKEWHLVRVGRTTKQGKTAKLSNNSRNRITCSMEYQ